MNDRDSIQRYLLGIADEDDLKHLDERVCDDSEFRQRFVRRLLLDSALRDIAAEDTLASPAIVKTDAGGRRLAWTAIASLAACLLLVLGWNWLASGPTPIAKLVDSEGAAWVSDLPTSVGSVLPPGELQLVSGIATLQFDSGAMMVLEAHARLRLESDMKAHLLEGAAVLEVPDSAIGFVVTTPSGDAIDLGTRFAVSVDGATRTSEFEVLEGSISVGSPDNDQRVTLLDNQAVKVNGDGISDLPTTESVSETSEPEPADVIRIGTEGRSTTFIRGNKHPQQRDPRLLLVKSSWSQNTYDRKAVFAFDASAVDMDSVQTVRLRLNQVESSVGFASRLPPINVFSAYGLTDTDKDGWTKKSTWQQAPSPEDGVLLGQFQIPRSRTSGECVVETDELLRFVREHQDRQLTFILVRKTMKIPGDGRVLVHAFASASHPSAVGPTLEFESTLP